MPRAAILSPFPDGNTGGIERFCQQLARALRDDGWEAEIVGPGEEPNRWIDRLGGGSLWRSRRAAAGGAALSPDLIVGNNWLGWGAPRAIPRIQTFHCTLPGLTRAAGGALSRQERLRRLTFASACEALGTRGATVVAVSHDTATEVRRYYRVADPLVIGHGVDTDLFSPGERQAAAAALGFDGPAALFVGRGEYGKGADVVVAGARDAGFAVAHAGGGSIPGARSLGALSHAELVTALRAADCLLLPTRYEAFGLAFLEAAATGTPIVATNVGWMRDLVAHVPAYRQLLIAPEPESIAAGLRALAAVDTEALTAAARAHVCEHASHEAFARAWVSLCSRVVEGRPAVVAR